MAATGLWDDPGTLWDDPAVRWDSPQLNPADLKQSTSVAGKILASGQVAGTSNTTIYTVPASSMVTIATAVLCNVSGAAVTVTVSVVPAGGSAGGAYRVIPAFALAAGDSTKLTEIEGARIDDGVFVSLLCSTGAAIDYLLTGLVAS